MARAPSTLTLSVSEAITKRPSSSETLCASRANAADNEIVDGDA
jgi:hypothetical protein